MAEEHQYNLTTVWTGNTGTGTNNYRSYERSITVMAKNKADILCTSDTAFNSDKTKHNPEELLLASIFKLPLTLVFAPLFTSRRNRK